MKNETLLTAVVFLGIGFAAGYVYKAQADHGAATAPAAAPSAPGGAGAAAGAAALPPGHPPLEADAMAQTLEQQVAANPQDPAASLKLADYLYDQGQFEPAIRWYQKALDLDPTNVNASTDLGTCYFNIGKADEALRQFRHSLTLQPRHQPTLYNMVVVYLDGTHDYKAARQTLETLQRLNPAYPKLDQLKQQLEAAAGKG